MTRAQNNILFIASAILILVASVNSPVLLIYPIFVLAVVKQWQLPTFSSVALQYLWGMILLVLDIIPLAKLPMKEYLFW